jgi:hypothetical protein
MTPRQQDTAAISLAGRSAWRIEFISSPRDERTAAGRARVDANRLGVALTAKHG